MHESIGRTRTSEDRLDPARAEALHQVLGREGEPPAAGDPLPDFWHHIYFWEAARPGMLGEDGHPKRGGFIPDFGLPRRMWAGGRYRKESPLMLGEPAAKTSTIKNVVRKSGRSGELAFVEIAHEIRQAGRLAVSEIQNLVFREDSRAGEPAKEQPSAPVGETRSERTAFDPVILFRFSALTFNGHRIHYDSDYCREEEGYRGLVVHGPLQSIRLVGLAAALLGGLREYAYRATAPLFAGEAAEFCAKEKDGELELWVRGPGGRLCMTGTAK